MSYGHTPADHSGSRASTASWYCALLAPFGIGNPARSKNPSIEVSADPKSVYRLPSGSLRPVIGFPALPVNRNPETDDTPYLCDGSPVEGSIQRAKTLTPCMGWAIAPKRSTKYTEP